MAFFDRLRHALGSKSTNIESTTSTTTSTTTTPPPAPAKTRSKRKNTTPLEKTPKDMATDRGEPYVCVTQVHLDPLDLASGNFELDWNDKFIAQLVRAGFQQQANESEHVIVDRWFQTVCRNVLSENYEQQQADPDLRRSQNRRDLGQGRSEFS